MKILIGTHFYTPYIDGGAEISTQLLAEGLVKLGHAVDVVAIGPEDSAEWINGVKIIRWYVKHSSEIILRPMIEGMALPGRIARFISKYAEIAYHPILYRRFANLIDEGGYELVVTSTSLSHFGRHNLWKAARGKGKAVVQIFRDYQLARLQNGGAVINRLYRAYMSRETCKWVSGAAGCSRAVMDALPDYWRGKPMAVIYNAVDVPFEKPLSKRNQTVVYAGRVAAEKGILTLIQAFAIADVKGSELYIVGRGALLNGKKLPDNVRLIPWLEKSALYELFRASALVVLPSEWEEPFGRTLIEAVANGTAAVGANIGGIPEVFGHMEKYLFPPGDAHALAEKIKCYLEASPTQYNEDIRELQETFSRYTAENNARSYERFFESLIITKKAD